MPYKGAAELSQQADISSHGKPIRKRKLERTRHGRESDDNDDPQSSFTHQPSDASVKHGLALDSGERQVGAVSQCVGAPLSSVEQPN